MKRSLASAILAFAAIAPCGAWAQQAPAPEPVLQVTIDPPRVVVGQRTTLRIDVLAPNYMTSPPELPGFQVRNAVTRQLQSVNLSEQRNGTSYAGVRFEFAIYPQEPGAFAISDQKVKVKYAAEPPAVREEAACAAARVLRGFHSRCRRRPEPVPRRQPADASNNPSSVRRTSSRSGIPSPAP